VFNDEIFVNVELVPPTIEYPNRLPVTSSSEIESSSADDIGSTSTSEIITRH